ncbi:MAG: TlpA family protein disulfide reductase [Actinomycetota bacterium]
MAVAALAVVLVAVLLGTGGDGTVAMGESAPELTLTDFEGSQFSFADYEGTPLVVNFWASWCPFCVSEMPDFERVHQALGDEVVFLGVDQRDRRDRALELARQTGVTYRLVWDPRGEVFDAFGGPGMPTTAFIDAEGTVVEVIPGQLSAGLLRDHIQRNFGIG